MQIQRIKMKKIIIIDDEESIRDLLKDYLTEKGYGVETFSRYETFNNQKADFYFFDHDIRGGISGSSFLRKNHMDENKLVLMSAEDSWKEFSSKYKLEKPFDFDTIEKNITLFLILHV